MSFPSFVKKYGVEALAIAEALNSVIGGIALPHEERQRVQDAIDALQAAAENIGKNRVANVVINQSDIDKAVAKELAKSLPKLVERAVADALAKAKDAGK
jgi:hypothetical protein